MTWSTSVPAGLPRTRHCHRGQPAATGGRVRVLFRASRAHSRDAGRRQDRRRRPPVETRLPPRSGGLAHRALQCRVGQPPSDPASRPAHPTSCTRPTTDVRSARSTGARPGRPSTPRACPMAAGPPTVSTSPPAMACTSTRSTHGACSSAIPTSVSLPATTAGPAGTARPAAASRDRGSTPRTGWNSTRTCAGGCGRS
jgi:hypothetical protein